MNESGIELRPALSAARPVVEYDEDLSTAPYAVRINRAELAALLKHLGMKDEAIREMKVHVARELKPRQTFPERDTEELDDHHPKVIQINVGLDRAWGLYENYLNLAKDAIEKKKTLSEDEFKGFLYSKKWPQYLAEAPPERSLQFANRMLSKALMREQNSILHLEIGHALGPRLQMRERKKWVQRAFCTLIGLGLGGIMGIAVGLFGGPEYYKTGVGGMVATGISTAILASFGWPETLSRMEVGDRSPELVAAIRDHPEWGSIITINPKSEISNKFLTNSKP